MVSSACLKHPSWCASALIALAVLTLPAAGYAQAMEGAPAAECFPACRTGYLCHQGQCISACNPGCGEGEICAASGECVSACNPPCASGFTCKSDGNCAYTPSSAVAAPPAQTTAPALTPSSPTETVAPASPPVVQPWSRAQPTEPSTSHIKPGSRIWFEMVSFSGTFKTGDDDGSVDGPTIIGISPSVRGRIVHNRFMVEGEIPFMGSVFIPASNSSGDTLSDFRVGNPAISASSMVDIGDTAWMSGGIGLTLPLANFPEEADAETRAGTLNSATTAVAMRGHWDVHKFALEDFALFFPFEIEGGTETFRIGAELGVVRLIDISDADIEDRVWVQVGGRVQGYLNDHTSLGVRLRGVGEAVGAPDDSDAFQASLEPFVDIVTSGVVLGVGIVVNLDDPNGLANDELSVWGLRLSAGGQL